MAVVPWLFSADASRISDGPQSCGRANAKPPKRGENLERTKSLSGQRSRHPLEIRKALLEIQGIWKIKMVSPPVLLVIDLQEGIVEGGDGAGPRSTPNLTANVENVLQTWRTRGWPLIHIHHDDPDPDHPIHKISHPERFVAHPCSAPRRDETVLYKHVGSAFVDPQLRLAERLSQLGGKCAEVIIIGMDGAQCVNDNARAANDLGFKVTVIAEACATYGMEDYRGGGRAISAEDAHVAAMSILANGFAKVVTLNDFLALHP